ncbi:MAG: hypothetical protein KA714_21500 [Limnoraphis sp. WC205]|nr:hypothetical protein [Limnoraphis sp. WC205]
MKLFRVNAMEAGAGKPDTGFLQAARYGRSTGYAIAISEIIACRLGEGTQPNILSVMRSQCYEIIGDSL